MFAKLFTVLVFAIVIAAVMLGMRQQRLAIRHEMTQLHAEMDRLRQRTWDLQVRIAERTGPDALDSALARRQLTTAPATADLASPTPSDAQLARRPTHD